MTSEFLICVPEDERSRISLGLAERAPAPCRFTRPEQLLDRLRRPPTPELLVVHPAADQPFTPELLARMRRHASPELRRIKVLALVEDAAAEQAWLAAGAVTARVRLEPGSLLRAMAGARAAAAHWIECPSYVGPCRRRRAALFCAKRRLQDSPWLKTDRGSSREIAGKTASVDVSRPIATVLRRLRIASQSLNLSDRDQRARFLSEVAAARNLAVVSGQNLAARPLGQLLATLEAAGAAGALRPEAIDSLLQAAHEALSEQPTAMH